ncbi:MAG: SWIM zinc finger family protein [Methanobacteriota archaeon]
MDRSPYKKGLSIAASGLVSVVSETENALYLSVTGEDGVYDVRLDKGRTFNCTCPWGSLKTAKSGGFCSHVIAAVIFAAGAGRRP